MKTILNSRRRHYVARVGTFLIVIALIVGMVGCSVSAFPTFYSELTIASTTGGSVTIPGEGTFTYSPGTVVGLVAEAEAGYHFDCWTGDVGTIASVNATSTTITVSGNQSITAEFVAEPSPPSSYNKLTIASITGGSVTTPGEGTFNYDEETVVNLVAIPSAGYHFDCWSGDVGTITDVNAAATTITVNGDYFIIANFAVDPQYLLIITSTEGGEVIGPGEGVFSYDEGTVVNLVAEAEEGYIFVKWTGDVGTIGDVDDVATTITMNSNYYITANFGYTPMVAAGYYHTAGLQSDGTVVAVGENSDYQCEVAIWEDITQVAAGALHTVGLKYYGEMVGVGDNSYGQRDVGGWTDIIQVAAGEYHTVGLESDGTVVAVGDNGDGRCDVGGWTNIIQVAACEAHTVGLESDGTVVAVGNNDAGQCNVGSLDGSIQIVAGCWHTVGLMSDGTVVAVGAEGVYDEGQCNVSGWTDIVYVAAGCYHTVGLKSDGTVVAVGNNDDGQCDVSGWDLIS